jgi:hypothetical protein
MIPAHGLVLKKEVTGVKLRLTIEVPASLDGETAKMKLIEAAIRRNGIVLLTPMLEHFDVDLVNVEEVDADGIQQ